MPNTSFDNQSSIKQAVEDLNTLYQAALFFGFTDEQAKLKASQGVANLHGLSFTSLLGIEDSSVTATTAQPEPESENNSADTTASSELMKHTNDKEVRLLSPSEIGVKLGGMSGMKVNKLLEAKGLQKRDENRSWVPTDVGRVFCYMFDRDCMPRTYSHVTYMKWYDTVLDVLVP